MRNHINMRLSALKINAAPYDKEPFAWQRSK